MMDTDDGGDPEYDVYSERKSPKRILQTHERIILIKKYAKRLREHLQSAHIEPNFDINQPSDQCLKTKLYKHQAVLFEGSVEAEKFWFIDRG